MRDYDEVPPVNQVATVNVRVWRSALFNDVAAHARTEAGGKQETAPSPRPAATDTLPGPTSLVIAVRGKQRRLPRWPPQSQVP